MATEKTALVLESLPECLMKRPLRIERPNHTQKKQSVQPGGSIE
jgi:hypothetical protein